MYDPYDPERIGPLENIEYQEIEMTMTEEEMRELVLANVKLSHETTGSTDEIEKALVDLTAERDDLNISIEILEGYLRSQD